MARTPPRVLQRLFTHQLLQKEGAGRVWGWGRGTPEDVLQLGNVSAPIQGDYMLRSAGISLGVRMVLIDFPSLPRGRLRGRFEDGDEVGKDLLGCFQGRSKLHI